MWCNLFLKDIVPIYNNRMITPKANNTISLKYLVITVCISANLHVSPPPLESLNIIIKLG